MLVSIKGKNLYIKFQNTLEDRPTIVFLHDSLGCTTLWREFPEKVAKATQCNFLVYDRLGYGKSDPMSTAKRTKNYKELDAEMLNDLLQKLGIKNAILFGHSDGGSIALIAASKYKERIKMIICEAAHIFVEDITLNGIHNAIETYKTTNLSERLQKYHGDKTETLFKAWTETWVSTEFRNWDITNLLDKITCPLLFIQGDKDEFGTLEQVNTTIKYVSGRAEKYIIPDVYHNPHKETPEKILSKTVDFINSLR